MLSPFNPSAGVAAISASISLSASSLHIAALAEAACSASNLESHSANRNEITSSIFAIFRVARNDLLVEEWRTEPTNFSGEEGYPPRSRTSSNDVAGLLQRTAAVTCRDQLFDKDQREACLRSRTW
jgi:hypothetical protein